MRPKECIPTLLTRRLYLKSIITSTCAVYPEWPEPVNRSFKHLNEEIYVMMQGPSEFKTGGRLLQWDISKRLGEITVPTLMVGARYDTMDPNYMKWMSKQVNNGQSLYCPNGNHLCFWDDQQVFMNGVIKFIKGVDERK
jgi:proline iminopeptidase